MSNQPNRYPGQLTAKQATLVILSGVTVWFGAALLVRWLIPLGALEGGMRLLTYAAVIPGTVPVVWGIARVARLGRAQLVPGMALGTSAATLCDGVALGWFPALYATDAAGAHLAGAAILWGAGVGILLAFALAGRISQD